MGPAARPVGECGVGGGWCRQARRLLSMEKNTETSISCRADFYDPECIVFPRLCQNEVEPRLDTG